MKNIHMGTCMLAVTISTFIFNYSFYFSFGANSRVQAFIYTSFVFRLLVTIQT